MSDYELAHFFEAQHVGEESDRFTRLVEDELVADVVPDNEQLAVFESTYDEMLEDHPPPTPLAGRTICVNFDPRCASFDILVDTMLAAIDKFLPGHTDVRQVPDAEFENSSTDLFQGKDATGADVLFVFDTREVGYNVNHLSLIGPFGETNLSLLCWREDANVIELCNSLNHLRAERVRELDRRAYLMESITTSLLDSDNGIGSIGADNLALVAGMLMRM
jgi:hypothetical protein